MKSIPNSWIFMAFYLALWPFFSSSIYAAMETSFEFQYDKKLYGEDDENSQVTRTYSTSVALYFSQFSAIECNFSHEDEITTEETSIRHPNYTNIEVIGMQVKKQERVYGVGIRQALAPRNYWLRPLLAIGYAAQFSKGQQDITFENTDNHQKLVVTKTADQVRANAIFASFTLQMQIISGLALHGSVKTVFDPDQVDQIKNNVKYVAGITVAF